MSEATPGSWHRAHRRRMLLLGGLAGAVLIAAALVVAFTLGGDPQGSGLVVGDGRGSAPTDPGPSSPDGDGRPAVPSPTGVIGSSSDPIAVGVETACAMFHQGATVDEFAVWFQADIGSVGRAEEELFRRILLEALTEDCPEVLATDD